MEKSFCRGGRKVYPGDVVEFNGETYRAVKESE